MFKHLSEDIIFLMIKNKILDIGSYDIYLYAVEILLLNGSILFACVFISIFAGELSHLLSFILFFIPLRMLAGGYHCKSSEKCFLYSVGAYGLSMVWLQYAGNTYVDLVTQILVVISVIIIVIGSPVIHPNHPLEEYQINRNKKIIYGMLGIDFVLYIIFYKFHMSMAFSERIFIILVAVALILGVKKEKRVEFGYKDRWFGTKK